MNLRGETREGIEAKLAGKSRDELLDLIHSLVTLEVHLRPSEIAQRAGLNKRRVLRALGSGDLRPYLALADNSLRVPISAVNAWLQKFRVPANGRNAR